VRLYINIDHVATIREARRTDEPDPFLAAREAESNGADGITFHLREDRRHINDDDARRIVTGIDSVANFELAAREDVIEVATELKPFQATLVPERREEVTTEGGLDLSGPNPGVRQAVRTLDKAGIRVSLFIDPDIEMIDQAKDLGVPAIELHTGRYSQAWHQDDRALRQLIEAAEYAAGIGLTVHAGHGLTSDNVAAVAKIPEIEELNIGHHIVSRAVSIGIGAATREMRLLIDGART
jgi:pyridoxine 5-phosphate synthase